MEEPVQIPQPWEVPRENHHYRPHGVYQEALTPEQWAEVDRKEAEEEQQYWQQKNQEWLERDARDALERMEAEHFTRAREAGVWLDEDLDDDEVYIDSQDEAARRSVQFLDSIHAHLTNLVLGVQSVMGKLGMGASFGLAKSLQLLDRPNYEDWQWNKLALDGSSSHFSWNVGETPFAEGSMMFRCLASAVFGMSLVSVCSITFRKIANLLKWLLKKNAFVPDQVLGRQLATALYSGLTGASAFLAVYSGYHAVQKVMTDGFGCLFCQANDNKGGQWHAVYLFYLMKLFELLELPLNAFRKRPQPFLPVYNRILMPILAWTWLSTGLSHSNLIVFTTSVFSFLFQLHNVRKTLHLPDVPYRRHLPLMSFLACGISLLVLPLPYLHQATQGHSCGKSSWTGFLITEFAYMSIFAGLVYAHLKNPIEPAVGEKRKSLEERRMMKRRRALERALLLQQSTQMSSLGSPTTAVAPVLPVVEPIQQVEVGEYQDWSQDYAKPQGPQGDPSPMTAVQQEQPWQQEGLHQRRQRQMSNDSNMSSVSQFTTATRMTTKTSMTTGSTVLIPDGVDEVVIDNWIVRRNGMGGIQVVPKEGGSPKRDLPILQTRLSPSKSVTDEVYPMSGF